MDNIRAIVIVYRITGKIMRIVLYILYITIVLNYTFCTLIMRNFEGDLGLLV